VDGAAHVRGADEHDDGMDQIGAVRESRQGPHNAIRQDRIYGGRQAPAAGQYDPHQSASEGGVGHAHVERAADGAQLALPNAKDHYEEHKQAARPKG